MPLAFCFLGELAFSSSATIQLTVPTQWVSRSPCYLSAGSLPLKEESVFRIANAYCRRLWGAGVKEVVYNKVEEPGEIT